MKSLINIRKGVYSNVIAFAWNILLAYAVYAICRIEFIAENWQTFKNSLFENNWTDLVKGSLLFDTSAILYTNCLYALLMLMPLPLAQSQGWRNIAKWVFIVVNTICAAANVIDSVYFQYTGRRTTMSVFSEFSNEGNLGSISLQNSFITGISFFLLHS